MKRWGMAISVMVLASAACQPDPGKPPKTLAYADLLDAGRPNPEHWPTYVPLSLSDKKTFSLVLPVFYEELVAGDRFSKEVEEGLLSVGLHLTEVRRQGETFVMLHEAGDTWRGRGGYLFRKGGGADEVLVQAPHSFHDHMTGELAWKAFEQSRARGFFFNTIHRYRSRRGERSRDAVHPADMARAQDSAFHLLSIHYLEAIPSGWVLQLHGYKSRKLDRKGIKAVISGGVEGDATSRSLVTQQTLADTFGHKKMALWPRDTDSFGALSNVLGGWCVQHAYGRFVHIELHYDLRERLLEDPAPLVEVIAQ